MRASGGSPGPPRHAPARPWPARDWAGSRPRAGGTMRGRARPLRPRKRLKDARPGLVVKWRPRREERPM